MIKVAGNIKVHEKTSSSFNKGFQSFQARKTQRAPVLNRQMERKQNGMMSSETLFLVCEFYLKMSPTVRMTSFSGGISTKNHTICKLAYFFLFF